MQTGDRLSLLFARTDYPGVIAIDLTEREEVAALDEAFLIHLVSGNSTTIHELRLSIHATDCRAPAGHSES